MENKENVKKIFNFLLTIGCTPQGAAGMTGNIYGESRCNPMCIEALLLQAYKDDHFLRWKYGSYDENSYKQYWEYVKTGLISMEEFLTPRAYTGVVHQYGAGICQWAEKNRKKKWLSLAEDDKKPLTDLGVQLNFLYYELKNAFPDVTRVLHSSTNVAICSNYVLENFERPANAEILREERYSYAKEIYGKYRERIEVKEMSLNSDKVIAVAENEAGYLEKKNGTSLDSKTRNAGKSNYTKYWRDLKPSFQGQSWCKAFVDWCMKKAYGSDAAKFLMCGSYGDYYTPTSAESYKKAGRFDKSPQKGDEIFFENSVRIHHTGLVKKVANGKVYTIEGNTSGASGVIANGGGVCEKSYKLSDPRIAGYGHPRYDSAKETPQEITKNTVGGYMFVADEFKRGDKNMSVFLFQQLFNARNAWYKWGQKSLALDKDCGPDTEAAVRWYQKQRGLKADGVCGQATWKDILALKTA